jgi:hypothetical protein
MTRRAAPISPPAALCAFALAALFASCAAPAPGDRSHLAVPPREGFEPVSELLHARCGSLDCHGQVGRFLRLYGANGLRLDSSDLPGQDAGLTRATEHDANYASVVALEPEMLSSVLRDAGRNPERLTLIRKGRGSEEHVGGAASPRASDSDRCLVSWLSAAVDVPACRAGALLERPAAR